MKKRLQFNNKGTFKILQFTDVHWTDGNDDNLRTNMLMEEILKEENPDPVIFTGDTISSPDKEIDLIIDRGMEKNGIEIKSGGTINEKYFDGLKYWSELTKTERRKMYLIYGGEENLIRNDMSVVSWKNIYDQIIAKSP